MPSPGDFVLPSPAGWTAARSASAAAQAALRLTPDYRPYDGLIGTLADADPGLKSGYYNHAPMVVEALCALGQADAASAWLARARTDIIYRGDLRPALPQARTPALGEVDQYADWVSVFEAELAHAPFKAVLARWLPPLSDGFATAAVHAALQTAHAVRALARADTPPRRRALANALAAWASRRRSLPVTPPAQDPDGALSFAEALGRITPVPLDVAPQAGAITTGLQALADLPDFGAELGAARLAGPLMAQFDGLTTSFAVMGLELIRSPYTAIVFIHAVTGAEAARILARHVPELVGRTLLYRAWEVGAGLYAAFSAPARALPEPASVRLLTDPAGAAAAHGDDHVIKLTDAALGAYRRTRDPVFLHLIARVHAVVPRPACA